MKNIILFISMCLLFACYDNTSKPQAIPRDIYERMMTPTPLEIVPPLQAAVSEAVEESDECQTLEPNSIALTAQAIADTYPADTSNCLVVKLLNLLNDATISLDSLSLMLRDTLTFTFIQKDTLIQLSKDWAILFKEYYIYLDLWYKPHIVDLNKKDTVEVKYDLVVFDSSSHRREEEEVWGTGLYDRIYDDEFVWSTELYKGGFYYTPSPNFRYIKTTFFESGYVYNFEYIYHHGRQYCAILDLKKAKIISIDTGMACVYYEWDDEMIVKIIEKYEREN